MIYPVILSGGSGSRLWPMSRTNQPKQFLSLLGKLSLFQETLLRASKVPGALEPIMVCAEDHRFMVGDQLSQIGQRADAIILEPCARNTAPAIALAAMHVHAKMPDGLMLVLPADHQINAADAFADAVSRAVPAARAGQLMTFGIAAEAPETGYGYILAGDALDADSHRVAKFVEKPDRASAERMLADGGYTWNSGMFLFRADVFLDELREHAPEMLAAVSAAFQRGRQDMDFFRPDSDAFAQAPNDSIDYAVMERTERAGVVSVSCGWSDIGSWSSYWAALEKDTAGNAHRGDVVSIDGQNNLIMASERRMVAAVGVDDLVIVDTPDAVLVARKDRVQDVKAIVAQIKDSGGDEHNFHRRVYRPWGNYDSVDQGSSFQVKRITVSPGAVLSLQSHKYRAEHWVVVSGIAEVTCDDTVTLLGANESTFIPLGSKHRLRNPGKLPLEIIEVQTGTYLGEDDITRYEDVYGRDAAVAAG